MSEKLTDPDREYIFAAKSLGCAVAEKAILNGDPCWGHVEGQHMTDRGRRIGHRFLYPLCQGHHQYGKISIGHGKKTFEKHYGSEWDLLAQTYQKLGREMPIRKPSKAVKRYERS